MRQIGIGLFVALLLSLGCASTPEPPPPPPPPAEPAPPPPPPPPDPTTFTASVEFEPGSAALTEAGVRELTAFAAKLTPYPERRIHIVGHSASGGADKGNPWLSEQRARSVASFLNSQGIATEHLTLEGAGSDTSRGPSARVTVR